MHERQHALDDIDNGYPGMWYYIQHQDLRWEFEKRAYLVELEIYKRYNVGEKYIKRLKKLMDNEYNEIYHKGDESK